MVRGRIKDPSLAAEILPTDIDWWRVTLPVTLQFGEEVAGLDLAGRTVTCFQHVLRDTAATLLPLVAAGATVRLAACNPDSTDDAAAAYLAAQGMEVWAWSGMTDSEFRAGLDWAAAEPADVVSDMGGELIAAFAGAGYEVSGALEATTTGLHRLETIDLPFPVFNWNDARLKNRIHNRHHVGIEMWPMFSAVTGIGIQGRSVLVLGFGPVGRGVALHARALGAAVSVVELEPVRALEALQHGCRIVDLERGLAEASVVVTATGVEGVLGRSELTLLGDGAIVCNVGHSNREIDVEWLDENHDRTPMRRHIARYDVNGSAIYLLNRGSLLNLAPSVMPGIEELFDPFSAMILGGLSWLLEGGAADAVPGIHPYPAPLEDEIARRTLAARR